MRLGTYYRALMWDKLGIRASSSMVLDIGGFDGYWLSQQPTGIRICVDLSPQKKYEGVTYVKADALSLPFRDGCFDQVFAFDIIEHIDDDNQFLQELHRVARTNGQIIISTPHKHITIFPPFLTNWVSKRWGHYRISGYMESEVRKIIPENDTAEFLYLRELFFRTSYLLLRFLWGLNRKIARPLVGAIAYLDTVFLNGENGYIVVCITRKT